MFHDETLVSSLREIYLRPVLDPAGEIRLLPSLLPPPAYRLHFFVISRSGGFLITYAIVV